MLVESGKCKVCGAPEYVPCVWGGIIPPTPQKTCGCTGRRMTQAEYDEWLANEIEHFNHYSR